MSTAEVQGVRVAMSTCPLVTSSTFGSLTTCKCEHAPQSSTIRHIEPDNLTISSMHLPEVDRRSSDSTARHKDV